MWFSLVLLSSKLHCFWPYVVKVICVWKSVVEPGCWTCCFRQFVWLFLTAFDHFQVVNREGKDLGALVSWCGDVC